MLSMGFATDAIHSGALHEDLTGAVSSPIYMTSTFVQNGLDTDASYQYSRVNNPGRAALEQCIAVLEHGKHGIAFSSGVAAVHSIMALLRAGDHVLVAAEVYGGTYRLFQQVMSVFSVTTTFVTISDITALKAAVTPETKLVFIETPSNPLLSITDIEAVSLFAKQHGLISVADNTFMTPYFQNPLDLGIDIVLHSTSKYISGHSDIIGGVVIVNDDDINKKLRFHQKAVGAIPSPFDCWLTLRSVKTLSLRMQQHHENACAVAEFLSHHPKVQKIYFPGLATGKDAELIKKQMRGFGGVVTIELTDYETTTHFLKRLRYFSLAESLGGIESLVNHSASMSHASVPREQREAAGITENLLRLSIGIEDLDDLIQDLSQALS